MSDFQKIALTSLLVAALTAAVLWAALRGGEDDRPPVVVSNGSVLIEAQVDGKDGTRGAFEEVTPGDKKKWKAGHGKGKAPGKLTVIVNDSTSAAPECDATYLHKNIKSVVFSYKLPDSVGGSTADFTAAVLNGSLEFGFPVDVDREAGKNYRLIIPSATTLTSVTIGGTTCDLSLRSRVELRSRK